MTVGDARAGRRSATRWALRVGLVLLVLTAGVGALLDGRVPPEERRSVLVPALAGAPEHHLRDDRAFDAARIDPLAVLARGGATAAGAALVTFAVLRYRAR